METLIKENEKLVSCINKRFKVNFLNFLHVARYYQEK